MRLDQPDRVFEFLSKWQSKLEIAFLRRASAKLTNDQRAKLFTDSGIGGESTEKVE